MPDVYPGIFGLDKSKTDITNFHKLIHGKGYTKLVWEWNEDRGFWVVTCSPTQMDGS